MDTQPQVELSYRSLFAVRGFRRFALTMLLGRAAEQMWMVVMVLFVLQRFHSPTLAGVVFFLGLAPGLFLSPVAGSLLDRYGRARFITFDYVVATVALSGIALLGLTGALTPGRLIPLAILGGITGMLSAAGMRSMLPLMLPQRLWDRGNAFDSAGYTIVAVGGPALGGALVGFFGGEVALLVTAAVFLIAAVSIIGIPEPRPASGSSGSLLRDAAASLRYVVGNRALRGLALTLTVVNVGAGIVLVALPVLVLGPARGNPTLVGLILALQGVGGVVSALAFGRVPTQGRERVAIAACAAVMAGATALLLVPTLATAALGSLLIGVAIGPMDVSVFSLRQRVTDPAWLGRAIAVSMSLNFVGFPLGSALAGPLLGLGLQGAIGISVALGLAGAGVALAALPRSDRAVR
jgi:MFS family permease